MRFELLPFLRDQKSSRVYVKNVDLKNSLVQFYYYGNTSRQSEVVLVGGERVAVTYRSKREIEPDAGFDMRFFFWIPFDPGRSIAVEIGGVQRVIRCRDVSLGKTVPMSILLSHFRGDDRNGGFLGRIRGEGKVRSFARSEVNLAKYGQSWVLMDRDDKADDNAEHLYRYIRSVEPKLPIFFVLRRDTADWKRLGKDAFRLLEFGSIEHQLAMANARVFASSHLTEPLLTPFTQDLAEWLKLPSHKTVFLQHGTTLADNSRMFNSKVVDLFCVTTQGEYDSMAPESSNYIISEKEVALTGFARHDALLKLPQTNRHILVMPTWRRTLAGLATGDGLKRDLVRGFTESAFYLNWRAFLMSESLKQLAQNLDLEIVFAPHPNLVPYLDSLELPSHVRVYNQFTDGALQDYFASAAVLVTDYSSVAFDVAYLLKPVVYFQFDAATIYQDHLPKGYFDFERDGFGPVCITADDAVQSVETALNGTVDAKYRLRQEQTFPLRDGKCCERIYLRILDMLSDP
jgi:CDP-glycerol glycerophosphotransferase (TagB/SpsB family)